MAAVARALGLLLMFSCHMIAYVMSSILCKQLNCLICQLSFETPGSLVLGHESHSRGVAEAGRGRGCKFYSEKGKKRMVFCINRRDQHLLNIRNMYMYLHLMVLPL